MNTTDTITYEKVMIPIRLTPETYEKLVNKILGQKKKQRGYSMNQYITALIEKELQIKRKY